MYIARRGAGEYAYIYWKQDNSIITLNLPLKKPLEEETAFWLYTGKARLDLATGVVPTEAEIGSSTFLVAKPWVDRIIKDCVSNGQKITIPKREAKRKARASKSLQRRPTSSLPLNQLERAKSYRTAIIAICH